MSALQKEYNSLKLKFPGTIIWFSINNYLESFSDCAVKTSDVLKTTLTKIPNKKLVVTGFPMTSLDKNLKKMINNRYKVCIVNSSYINNLKVKKKV